MPNDVYTHFFFFSAIPLPLISFLCFLSLSILLRFVSLSFAHSANLYFLVGMWIWFARQYIFIRRKFRIEPFIWMVEFSHDTHTQILCVGLQFLSKVQFEMHILSHANERWNDDDAAAIVSHHAVAHSHNQTKSATDWMLAGWVRVRVCLRVCACVYVCESTCICVRCARALIHIHST